MATDKILEIKECCHEGMEGYTIKTEKHIMSIMINNRQCCCEDWGYVCSSDDYQDYIGAELNSYKVVDTALNGLTDINVWDGDAMFFTLETSKGDLQFSVYNSQNGYYGHRAIIKVDDKIIEDEYL